MSESQRRLTVDQIDWRRVFIFPRITRAFSLAYQPARILMGLATVIVLMITGGLWDWFAGLFSADEAYQPFARTVNTVAFHLREAAFNGLALDLPGILDNLLQIAVGLPMALWADHPIFLIVFGAWAIIVLWTGLGAISRSAACEFAVEQHIPWTEALAFALKRWMPLVGTITIPIAALLIGVLMLAVGGLLLAVPGLNILAAILYAVALFGGFIAALIILLSLASAGLWIPAVTVEATDAPDALARGFSYVKNRPLHWLWYSFLALIQGTAGLVFVGIVAALTINFTAWGAGLFIRSDLAEYAGGAGLLHIVAEEPDQFSGTARVAASFIMLWRTVIAGLVGGWILAYAACAMTVVYFLLRKATDDQEFDEIWQPGQIAGTMAPERTAMTSQGTEARGPKSQAD